jgi:nitronate monooxygenase
MAFCQRYGLRIPILLAPMAGSCPVSLAVAVADAGGMGAMGALLSSPDAIANWAAEFRSRSLGPFQLNLWIAEPAPMRDFAAEQRVREFLSSWGPTVPAGASGIQFPDFEKQCDSFIAIRPTVVSSIMGLYPSPFVAKLKDQGIAWFACATTLAEAREAERAGADAIVAQGYEAGAIEALLIKRLRSVKVSAFLRCCHAWRINSRFRLSLRVASQKGEGSPPR